MNTFTLLAADASNIMAYMVDVGVVLFIAVFMIVCAKKGFINCVFGLVASIVAIMAAVSFASLAVDLTVGLFGLKQAMTDSFINAFSNLNGFNVVIEGDVDLVELLASQDMSAILANLIAQNFVDVPEGYTLGMLTGETVGNYAALLISGVALFVIFRILFAILKKIFNFVAKDGLLGVMNKLLGACVGLIEAVLIISLAVAILAMFPSMMEFLNSSLILTAIYNNNPLMWLLSLFLFI